MASSRSREEAGAVGPLAGLNVLELGNMIAAPTAGCLLGDFGAQVVKAEHPSLGDDLRHWPPSKDGVPLWWKVTNRNKKLITLNLSRPAGQEICLRMLPDFDIVIENFRPGTMERWNLGYEQLAAVNPRIIMIRVSGYGQTGPYSGRAGYGTVAEAMSGIPSFTGFPETPPTLSAFPLVDSLAGMFAAQAALMAVYERDIAASGKGQVIDVSLYESIFRLIDSQVIGYDQKGIVKERQGNRMVEDSPRNAYKTADGEYVAISAGSQRTFSRLAEAIGLPSLNADPRFATNEARCDNADALDEIVAAWFASRTLDQAMRELDLAGAVAGPVYDIQRIMKDPHFAAREDIVTVADPQLGDIKMQAVLPKFSRTPGTIRWPGGQMGQHNEQVFGEALGIPRDELARLRADGVI
jgi:crotonobetainyl-CoA:carnitine CoA-transferase CaiB-like acyl-CoA transferase